MTIFSRILTACILPFIVILAAIVFSVNNIVYNKVVSFADEKTKYFAIETAKQINDELKNVQGLTEVMAAHLAKADYSAPGAEDATEEWIRSILKATPYAHCIWFSFEPGKFSRDGRFSRDLVKIGDSIAVVNDLDDEFLDDPKEAPWYYYPFTTGKIWHENADYYDYGVGLGSNYTGTVSAPVIRGGKPVGVVGVDILYKRSFHFIDEKQVKGKQLILIITHEGEIVYSPDSAMLTKKIFDMNFARKNLVQERISGNRSIQVSDVSPVFGVRSSMYFYPISSAEAGFRNKQLYLYVDLPTKELFAEAQKISRTTVIISAVGLFLLACVLFLVIRSVLRPVKKLTESANRIARGDRDINIDAIFDTKAGKGKVRGKDEIRTLFVSLKKMLAQLNNMEEISNLNTRLEAALKTKDRFLARMSHEIRTPMNAITGMTELALREKISPPAAREHVFTIRQASANLLAIINDILDLSKINSGKLEIMPADYSLSSLVNDVVSIIRVRVMDTGVRFETDIDAQIPNALFGDEVRIRQVLINVLSNAVKYTSSGSVSLAIRGEVTDAETVLLTMDIADTGKGIREEDIEKLFGEFIQLDSEAGRGVEGTGLGLSITKSLVSAMGGKISVSSVYGEGSTFTITLPQKIRSPEPLGTAGLSRSGDAGKRTVISFSAPEARVLVVDDIETNLLVATSLLAPYKMRVDSAESGAESIRMAEASRYDVIFMDHMMPEMDGVEAARRIRELGGYYESSPIIALTANAVSGAREMFLQNGFDDFLSKPIDTVKLNAMLERWVPKEKQAAAASSIAGEEVCSDEFYIEGVDPALGICRTGGTVAGYFRTLAVFCRDGRKRVEDIDGALGAGDIKLYITHIHALKSAAANIGAVDLSENAKALEAAGQRGDMAYIKARHTRFLMKLGTLLDDADRALAAEKEKRAEADVDAGALKAALACLRAAIGDIDPDAISAAEKGLERFGGAAEIGGVIEDIRKNVLDGEYDAALSLIEEMERKG